jgi:hypothetical protein
MLLVHNETGRRTMKPWMIMSIQEGAAIVLAFVLACGGCNKNEIDPHCAQLYTHSQSSSVGLKAEMALKGYDLGKAGVTASQVTKFEVDIDDILQEHNMMSTNLCNMWAHGVIDNDQYFATQTCYDSNQRKLRTHVLGLKNGLFDGTSFSVALEGLNGEYDKCLAPGVADKPAPKGSKSSTPGAVCGSSADCERPLYCILGTCRTPGEEGDACSLGVDCSAPLACVKGACAKIEPSLFLGSACASDDECRIPLFCISGGCAPLGSMDSVCARDVDCYVPFVCTGGKCGPAGGIPEKYGKACTSDVFCSEGSLFCIGKTCRYLGTLGAACGSDADCHMPFSCYSGTCSHASVKEAPVTTAWSSTVNAGVSTGPDGSGAKACTQAGQCVPPDTCIVGFCRPPQPKGGVCHASPDCVQQTECILGTCGGLKPETEVSFPPSAMVCQTSATCPFSCTCVNGACTASSESTPCTTDGDCASPLFCIVGQCREMQGPGGVCSKNMDCMPPLSCSGGLCIE